MSVIDAPVDAHGRETLDAIARTLGRYNRWMYDQLAPHIAGRVLEIGSGIGTMSSFLAEGGRQRLALSDVEPDSLAELRTRFANHPGITIDHWDLGVEPPPGIAAEQFDTVVCLNVLEHIQDDHAALARMHARLAPGGRLVLLVPAHQMLFNGFDRGVAHFRRYNRKGVAAELAKADFAVEKTWYFNMLGALGWYVNGNLLGKTQLPEGQLALIDALVPVLRAESYMPRPFGLSVIAIGRKPG